MISKRSLMGLIVMVLAAVEVGLIALPALGFADKIVFSSKRDGDNEIFIMNPDGSSQTQLTFNTASDYLPSLSPDKTKIAFSSKRDGNYEIYTMNTDGTDQTRLTFDSKFDEYPTFSPNGSQIIFASNRDGDYEIYRMDTNGSNLTPLTANSSHDLNPVHSPDGTEITFVSRRDNNWEIYTMDADGSNQTRLTNHQGKDWFPSYSPDGTKIAFTSSRSGGLEIFKMDANGSNVNRLTFSSGQDLYSSYSPDGSRIAFASKRDGDYEVFTIEPDGTNTTQVTFNSSVDLYPFWGQTADVPVTTISTSPSSPDGESGWFINPVTVSLTSNRPGSTYFSWNSSPPQGPGDPTTQGWSLYSGSFAALEGDNTLFYFSVDTGGNAESPPKSIQLKVDTQNPNNPSTLQSTSHSIGVPSVDDTIDVNWSGEADVPSGVDGFSVQWSNSSGTLPDQGKDLEESDSSTTSPNLANGSWWFHLRTKDNAGRWAGAIHLGPFIIGTAAPLAQGISHVECTNCHDSQVAGAQAIIPEFSKTSAHPLDPDVSTACKDCHNPGGDLNGGGLYYPRLLRALDPFATFHFLGNDYCGACHGAGSTLPGGDHLVYLTGTPHETEIAEPSSGTEIKCLGCHTQHGSNNPALVAEAIEAQTVTGINNTACYPCHDVEKGAYSGQSLYELTKHFTTGVSTKAEVVWPGGTYEKGYCLNCHNPHGSVSTDYRHDDKNALCEGCHDIAVIPAGYGYRGLTEYDLSGHGSNSDPDTVWPDPDETGAALGSGGATAGECINCHNVHGKDDAGSPTAKYTLRSEEGLCFGGDAVAGNCHASPDASASGIDIYERFTAGDGVASPPELSRHSITDFDQGLTGSKVECVNCHNTHLNNADNKNSDPDDVSTSFTDTMDDPRFFPKAVIQPGPSDGKDAIVASGFPTLNLGSTSSFQIGYINAASFQKSRGLYEFDVSAIPSGSTITSATLELYQNGSAGSTSLDIDLHRVTAGWNESTVDWNSQPIFDPTPDDSLSLVPTNGVWRVWDVTGLVDDWVNGAVTNNGVTLIAPGAESQTTNWYRVFDTSDRLLNPVLTYGIASRPKLTIEYTTATPPQVSDSIGFCGRCHDGAPPPGVNVPPSTRQIIPSYTQTDAQGDFHGGRAGVLNPVDTSEAEIIGPYYAGMPAIACSDCHDSHGSKNIYSIREEVNGKTGISVTSAGNKTAIRTFCGACHMFYHVPVQSCFDCHFHGANTDGDVNTVF